MLLTFWFSEKTVRSNNKYMSSTSTPDLIKITEIFLVPSSFMVAALGTADTNLHRAAVSVVGLIISALWMVCSLEAMSDSRQPSNGVDAIAHPRRIRILCVLPVVFMVGWILSTVVHTMMWNRPLGS